MTNQELAQFYQWREQSGETVADILREARAINPQNEWADRIEAAHRSEVEELQRRLKVAEDALNFIGADVSRLVKHIIADGLAAIREEGGEK